MRHKNSGSIDTVATVGICDVFPGAVNSIPSRVRLSLDVRDTDLARRDAVMQSDRARLAGNIRETKCVDSQRTAERRCACGLRRSGRRGAFACLREASAKVAANDQPRLPRFAFHLAHRAGGDAFHPLSQRVQPSSRTSTRLPTTSRAARWCSQKHWRACPPDLAGVPLSFSARRE